MLVAAASLAVADSAAFPPGISEVGFSIPILHSTRELATVSVDCAPAAYDPKLPIAIQLSEVQCHFSYLLLHNKPARTLPTFEAFQKEFAKESPAQVVREICSEPRIPKNPTVARLMQPARIYLAEKMKPVCGRCLEAPSVKCVYELLEALQLGSKGVCEISSGLFDARLVRQRGTWVWTGNLGGTCNTQVTVAFDESTKVWTYRQVKLTPEKCLLGQDADGNPHVYSTHYDYAMRDIPTFGVCDEISL